MLQLRMILIAFWCLLLNSGASQAQSEFSAVMVQNIQGSTSRAKVFSGKGKMRIEPDSSARNAPVVLLDFNRDSSFLLMPYQKSFIELSGLKEVSRGSMIFLTPFDTSRPCDILAPDARGSAVPCRNSGSTEVNGRKATQWTGTLPGGKEGYVWIDSKLNLIVKLETPGNSAELQDIREGTQDPKLFEVPDGYSRVRLESMQPAVTK